MLSEAKHLSPDLAGFLRPAKTRFASLRWCAKVVALCALTALAAQVKVPVPGSVVPMTLQSLAVLLAGFTLTPMQAASAMLLYVGAGTFGLPVFTGHSTGILGPTGGYLVGFVIGATAASIVKGRGQAGLMRLSTAGIVGMTCVLGCGAAWLLVWSGSPRTAITQGVAPFVLKSLIEIALAVVIVTAARGAKRIFASQKSAIGNRQLDNR